VTRSEASEAASLRGHLRALRGLSGALARASDVVELFRATQSLASLVPVARRFRWRAPMTPLAAARFTLKSLADRWAVLAAELRHLDHQLELLVSAAAPRLVALAGVGTETGGALLVAIGDNPDRLHSEAAFAAVCAVSPVEAHPDVSNAID
jgi:transposase